jgi:hypothetical protein
MPKLNLFLAEYNIFHVGCQNSACHLSHFYLEVTTKLVILAHYADYGLHFLALWQRWFYIPKRLDTTPTKKATCSNIHLLKRKQNGVSYSTRWYRIYGCSSDHNQKDLQLRQTQIAPTLRNRRVIAKNTELNKRYLRNTTDAVSCSTKWWGGPRRRRWHFRWYPQSLQRRWFCWHEDGAPRTTGCPRRHSPEDAGVQQASTNAWI